MPSTSTTLRIIYLAWCYSTTGRPAIFSNGSMCRLGHFWAKILALPFLLGLWPWKRSNLSAPKAQHNRPRLYLICNKTVIKITTLRFRLPLRPKAAKLRLYLIPILNICIGVWFSNLRIILSMAATSGLATWWLRVQSAALRQTATALCSNWLGKAQNQSQCPMAANADSSTMAIP